MNWIDFAFEIAEDQVIQLSYIFTARFENRAHEENETVADLIQLSSSHIAMVRVNGVRYPLSLPIPNVDGTETDNLRIENHLHHLGRELRAKYEVTDLEGSR